MYWLNLLTQNKLKYALTVQVLSVKSSYDIARYLACNIECNIVVCYGMLQVTFAKIRLSRETFIYV